MNMKSSWLVGLVVVAHGLVFGVVALLQGCGTVQTVPAGSPEPPPMPGHRPGEPRPKPAVVSPAIPAPIPHKPIQAVETTSYVVVKGDTLSQVARRFSVSMAEIMALNGLRDADTIRVGQTLLLPGKIDVTQPPRTPAASAAPATPSVPLGDGASVHVVRSGETLSHIAVQYGVSVAAIQRLNQMKGDRILAGQRLAIPDAPATPRKPRETPTQPKPVPAPIVQPAPPVETLSVPDPQPTEPDLRATSHQTYVVEVGDTLRSIAMNHAVSLSELRKLNRISETAEVAPGQTLKIPRFE